MTTYVDEHVYFGKNQNLRRRASLTASINRASGIQLLISPFSCAASVGEALNYNHVMRWNDATGRQFFRMRGHHRNQTFAYCFVNSVWPVMNPFALLIRLACGLDS